MLMTFGQVSPSLAICAVSSESILTEIMTNKPTYESVATTSDGHPSGTTGSPRPRHTLFRFADGWAAEILCCPTGNFAHSHAMLRSACLRWQTTATVWCDSRLTTDPEHDCCNNFCLRKSRAATASSPICWSIQVVLVRERLSRSAGYGHFR